MRIICDHCSLPISGTVKRLAGNFNLHPDCLAYLGKETRRELTAVSGQSQEPSIGTLDEWQGAGLVVDARMNKTGPSAV
jgi:hypothetical protein